ncbi:MAG: hypothetical protein IIT84_01460, partial [Oscillospiraceae bacterium]|nr:hypothetical protein [Oscillospiraceae bacterium]
HALIDYLADHVLQLLAQKDGHDGRRGFMPSQSLVVAHVEENTILRLKTLKRTVIINNSIQRTELKTKR